MADHFSKEKRSWIMSRVRSKDTKPEIAVRKMLHGAGFRFRLHVTALAGTPDIVLPKWKTVIFVHGCFWHRHEGCKKNRTPKTRPDWWTLKFNRTVARDLTYHKALEAAGWKVVTVWECEIRDKKKIVNRITSLI